MENRLTIITPSFEKHFLQFSRMVKSISENCTDKKNLDLIVVVENKNLDMFSTVVENYNDLSIKIITTENVMSEFNINESPGSFLKRIGKFTFQTLKKFGGMLAAETHWTLVLDSETVFYNQFSASELLKNYSEKKYVFYTSTTARGERWKQSTGLRINKNTSKALKIDSINRWYMDVLHWFYEKDKVQDLLFNKLGEEWFDLIIKSKEELDYFECILYYAYLNEYHKDEYDILDLQKVINEFVPSDIAGRFKLNELPFSLHGNDFLLSIVGAGEVSRLSKFFEHFKLPLIRLEPAYIKKTYIEELKALPYFCATVSTQYLMWMGSRIAVCLSGKFTHNEFRGYEQQVRNLLGFLGGVDCDLYIHNWKQACEAYIVDVLKPKKYFFEEEKNFKDIVEKINFNESSYLKPQRNQGTLSMFYSMEKVFSLIENPEDYDYIIRLRPDIYSEYSLKEILFSISDNGDFLPDVIYIPSSFQSKGMNDQFAIGRTELMAKYFSIYSYIIENIEHLFFNPESMLTKYIIENKIGIALLDMPYALHRGEIMRPWMTTALLHEQEKVWWSKTTHIAKLQDVTSHFENRYKSGKLLNTLPKNIRLLGEIEGEKNLILIESHDYDPHVNARACFKVFGIILPWKITSLKNIKSYSHTNYSSYYCVDMNKNGQLIVNQLISDWRTIQTSKITCKSYTELKEKNVHLLPLKITLFIISELRQINRFVRKVAAAYKSRLINKLDLT
ncbi:DUF6492 family protein [Pantoea stewartii]|uniref:DUF6492 family protein n=1 Tax=Pantoea stewartii TaxID=66269 RepID=UPI001980DE73|nr:DUF6492 family protein [Pantoea stewartii]